jgi:hypothetical protein
MSNANNRRPAQWLAYLVKVRLIGSLSKLLLTASPDKRRLRRLLILVKDLIDVEKIVPVSTGYRRYEIYPVF